MNEAEQNRERLRTLCQQIKRTADQEITQLKVDYPTIGNLSAINELATKLASCADLVNPDRKPRMVVVGNSSAGKSALIRALLNHLGVPLPHDIPVSRRRQPTNKLVIYDCGRFYIIDTIGFGTDAEAKKKLEEEFKKEKPDVLLVVAPDFTFAGNEELKRLNKATEDIKKLVKSIWKFSIPLIHVFNRVDEWEIPHSNEPWPIYCAHLNENIEDLKKEIAKKYQEELPSFRKDDNKLLAVTSVTPQGTYGIQQLIDMITSNPTLRGLIPESSEKFYVHYRRSTAASIISAFSGFNAVIGGLPLPVADIIITNRMTNIMLNLVAVLAVNPNRTVKAFEATYEAAFGVLSTVRYSLLILAKAFEFSGVFLPIGMAIGATAGGAATALVGWRAYEYFTD